MRKKLFLHLSICLVVLLSLIAAPTPARADVIDTLAKISDLIHPFSSAFPTYDDVQKAKPIITCIAGGGNAFQCVQDNGGQTGNEYIDTVVVLAQIFHMVQEEDVMGIVGVVGKWIGDDAVCIIVDILTGGAAGDLCDVLKAIVELAAKAVGAVLDFLAGLGEAIWDGLSAAAEAACEVFTLGMGDCGDDNSVPWYVFGYQLVFAPKIGDGVAARESVSDLFDVALSSLKAQLLATKVGLNMGFTQGDADMAGEMYRAVVEAAWSGDIVKAPDGKLWVLNKKRDTYFNDSQIMAQKVAEAVKHYDPSAYIWQSCTDDFKSAYGFAYIDRWLNWPIADANVKAAQKSISSNSKWCSSVYEYKHRPKEFAALYGAYVDKNLCKKVGEEFVCSSPNNLSECTRIMGKGVSYEAGQRCGLKPPTCQFTGTGNSLGLTCESLDDYKSCLAIMKGQTNHCHMNVQKAGMQIAAMIDDYFKQSGSQIPCQYGVLDFSKSGNPNTPVSFICPRPSQTYWCNQKYNEIIGTTAPIKFVDCLVAEEADYEQLKKRVNTVYQILKQGGTNNLHSSGPVSATAQVSAPATVSASDMLKTTKGDGDSKTQTAKPGMVSSAKDVQVWKPPCENKIVVSAADPLELAGQQCVVDRVQNDPNQDFGFKAPSSKPGFDYVKPASWNKIDGLTTPLLLVSSVENIKIDPGKVTKKPPLTTETLESKLKKPGEDRMGDIMKKEVTEKVVNPDSGMAPDTASAKQSLQSGKTATVVAGSSLAAASADMVGKGPGTALSGAGKSTTPMSGTLPSGAAPQGKAGLSGAPMTTPFSAATPDITAADQLKVSGLAAMWNGTITVNANQALSKNKNNSGLCEFALEYGVRNIGSANAAGFRSLWINNAVGGNWPRMWTPVAAGGSKIEKDILPLKPGVNVLQLVLDDMHQVKEMNVSNNTFRISVQVIGNCAAEARPAPAAVVQPMTPAPKLPVTGQSVKPKR